jgi:formate C-acetyltransferase
MAEAIDVRAFMQRNYTPYTGDGGFLAGSTERTLAVWERLAGLARFETPHGGFVWLLLP